MHREVSSDNIVDLCWHVMHITSFRLFSLSGAQVTFVSKDGPYNWTLLVLPSMFRAISLLWYYIQAGYQTSLLVLGELRWPVSRRHIVATIAGCGPLSLSLGRDRVFGFWATMASAIAVLWILGRSKAINLLKHCTGRIPSFNIPTQGLRLTGKGKWGTVQNNSSIDHQLYIVPF